MAKGGLVVAADDGEDVEEAWLAGDALPHIKQQLPHGTWTPAFAVRG